MSGRAPACGDCCTDPCTIGTDTFDTDLGQWTTIVGTASVFGGSMLMSTAFIEIFDPEPATADDGVRIQTFPLTADTTATMRLIAAWTDANNYLFGELDLSSGVGTIQLGQVSGGSETYLTDPETLEDTGAELNARSTATLCWDPGEEIDPVTLSTNSYAGLGVGAGWTNPNGVIDPAGAFAEFSAGSMTATNALSATAFSHALIPPGSTIDGIAVSALIEHDGMDVDYIDSLVKLIHPVGGAVGDNKATGLSLNAFETLQGWGGAADDWNAGLLWSDINNPAFGVVFEFTNNGNAGNIRLRGVEIRVWFTSPDRKGGRLTFSYGNTAAPNTKQCIKSFGVYGADGLKTGISTPAGDWDFTNYEVKYLESATHPTCPTCGEGDVCTIEEGPPCNCCDPEFPAAQQYVVDLTGGGWTDGGCTYCDEVNGAYVLDAAGDCRWIYGEALTPCPGHPCNCTNVRFLFINLWLRKDDEDVCRWELSVIVFTFCDPDDPGECGTGAHFVSDPLASDEDCQSMPVTLIKTVEATLYDCNGTLPGTVDIDLA